MCLVLRAMLSSVFAKVGAMRARYMKIYLPKKGPANAHTFLESTQAGDMAALLSSHCTLYILTLKLLVFLAIL